MAGEKCRLEKLLDRYDDYATAIGTWMLMTAGDIGSTGFVLSNNAAVGEQNPLVSKMIQDMGLYPGLITSNVLLIAGYGTAAFVGGKILKKATKYMTNKEYGESLPFYALAYASFMGIYNNVPYVLETLQNIMG